MWNNQRVNEFNIVMYDVRWFKHDLDMVLDMV